MMRASPSERSPSSSGMTPGRPNRPRRKRKVPREEMGPRALFRSEGPKNTPWRSALSCTGITLPASRGLNRGFEGDSIAEAFEAALEVGDGSGLADLVEIGFAEVSICQVLGEHMRGGDEDFVSDGERRAQGAAAGLEAMEFIFEIAAFGSCGGDGGADQDGAEVDVALPGPAALLPARTLMTAGTDAGPGRQVIDAQEYAHVDADLGDQHGRNQPVDARNLHQERVLHAI